MVIKDEIYILQGFSNTFICRLDFVQIFGHGANEQAAHLMNMVLKVSNAKSARILLLLLSSAILSMYYTIKYRFSAETKMTYQYYYNNSDDENYLINTPGCKIPNYMKTIHIQEAKHINKICGQRAVFIEKLSDENIQFRIDEKVMSLYKYGLISTQNTAYNCCYKFAGPHITKGKPDYRKLRYSSCIYFNNGTKSPLKEEVITVTCQKAGKKPTIIYEDSYIILKKIKRNVDLVYRNRWNILMIGMDTMSRARAYSSMPKTVQYLKAQDWLDYRGYQKVAYNTFPNVASFLSGKNVSVVQKVCYLGMDNCNKLFIWSDFQQFGYATAYGEDFITLPDTFSRYNGYINKPTDHYVRPLFLTGETTNGNLECTKKIPSTKHILDYALDFTRSYNDEGFFGLFWINSYSHNLNNNPTLLEDDMIVFFESLKNNNVLDNTFIFFLSDHGMRSGTMRIQYESYYDERLPMLFMWIPKGFRQSHKAEYEYLQMNQNKLVSPYDLYLTMWDIYRITNESAPIKNSEACLHCKSLMTEISPDRTCMEAGVDEKWCSCHKMDEADQKNKNVKRSIMTVVEYLQNISQSIKTIECTTCDKFQLKTIHRVHVYYDNNKTYYVIALAMTSDVGFEATVVENNGSLTIAQPTYTISTYNIRERCTVGRYDQAYCVCKRVANCLKKPKR